MSRNPINIRPRSSAAMRTLYGIVAEALDTDATDLALMLSHTDDPSAREIIHNGRVDFHVLAEHLAAMVYENVKGVDDSVIAALGIADSTYWRCAVAVGRHAQSGIPKPEPVVKERVAVPKADVKARLRSLSEHPASRPGLHLVRVGTRDDGEPFIVDDNGMDCPEWIDLSPHGSRDPLIQRLGVLRAYLDGTGFDTDHDFAGTVDEAIQVLVTVTA